ncbi:MAG: 16S rRNA (cytosine(1402)-N(4))-methyltransferase [Chloroflexi bacterium]|nr:16S rRNA (cytosine(1402)-N(4))-methyltransferase [Chloroflexota bacterium]
MLTNEVIKGLNITPGGRYIDATLGEGGHSTNILIKSDPGGQVLGIDADHEAVSVAQKRVNYSSDKFLAVNDNFKNIRSIAMKYNFSPVHGILFDLGVSSLQLDAESRGFSFRRADPLDMRFSYNQNLSASQIINNYDENELANIIFYFGEEKKSRKIAKTIVRNRPIKSSLELADLICEVIPRKKNQKINPATKTFQAIRIAVNDELSALETALNESLTVIGEGGRIAVISYHSLEDRIVKNFFKKQSSECICPPRSPVCICKHEKTIKIISKKPIIPSTNEVNNNPRSRSAKLRIAERI